MTEKENFQNNEDAIIKKLGMLSETNLTYFLLVAQALIAEENQEVPDSSN